MVESPRIVFSVPKVGPAVAGRPCFGDTTLLLDLMVSSKVLDRCFFLVDLIGLSFRRLRDDLPGFPKLE